MSESTLKWMLSRLCLMTLVCGGLWVFEKPPKIFAAILTVLAFGWWFGYITGHAEGVKDQKDKKQ